MNCKTTPPSVSLKSVCSVYFSRVQAELQPGVSLTCCRCMYQPSCPDLWVGWWCGGVVVRLILQALPGYFRGNSALSSLLVPVWGVCRGSSSCCLRTPTHLLSFSPVAEWWRFNPWKTRFQIALQLCFILDHDALLQVSAVLPLAGELCLLLRGWAVSGRGDCSHVSSDLFQMALQRELCALQAGRGSSGSKRAQVASGDSGVWFPYLLYYPFS